MIKSKSWYKQKIRLIQVESLRRNIALRRRRSFSNWETLSMIHDNQPKVLYLRYWRIVLILIIIISFKNIYWSKRPYYDGYNSSSWNYGEFGVKRNGVIYFRNNLWKIIYIKMPKFTSYLWIDEVAQSPHQSRDFLQFQRCITFIELGQSTCPVEP